MHPVRTMLTGAMAIAIVLGTSAAIAAPASAASTSSPHTAAVSATTTLPLRVANYNIRYGHTFSDVFDIEGTADAIRNLNADVVGLEEVDQNWGDRSQWMDLGEELAARTGMYWCSAPIYDVPNPDSSKPNERFGPGVLSKYPIEQCNNYDITRLSTQDPNPVPAMAPGFGQAVINVNGSRVQVWVTHLDFRADPSVREQQVKDMMQVMPEHQDGIPQILVGDFNADGSAPEFAPLWQKMTDAWASYGTGDGFTYPADDPTKRIDMITWVDDPDQPITASSIEVPSDPQYEMASDHRPVVADLNVSIDDEPAIASIAPVSPVSVPNGTNLTEAAAALPATTTITDTAGGQHDVPLSWTINGYNGSVAGDYRATGTFSLPADVRQTLPAMDLTVASTVTVQAAAPSPSPSSTPTSVTPASSGSLPDTGANPWPLIGCAIGLAAVGVLLVVLRRRGSAHRTNG